MLTVKPAGSIACAFGMAASVFGAIAAFLGGEAPCC